jgi:hypothetical protein
VFVQVQYPHSFNAAVFRFSIHSHVMLQSVEVQYPRSCNAADVIPIVRNKELTARSQPFFRRQHDIHNVLWIPGVH